MKKILVIILLTFLILSDKLVDGKLGGRSHITSRSMGDLKYSEKDLLLMKCSGTKSGTRGIKNC